MSCSSRHPACAASRSASNGDEGPPEGSPSPLAPRTAHPCAATLLKVGSVGVRAVLVRAVVPVLVLGAVLVVGYPVVVLLVDRVGVLVVVGPGGHALAERVAMVVVGAVEVLERL